MPPRRTTPFGYARACHLRKVPTPAEGKLWTYLRGEVLGVNFRRQHAIGPYIADFCAPRRKLILELDGSQHLERQAYDAERTRFLESRGCRVLRFWNREVMNDIQGVLAAIGLVLNDSTD
jgi:very-short-patch-repair endonuclease